MSGMEITLPSLGFQIAGVSVVSEIGKTRNKTEVIRILKISQLRAHIHQGRC